jgi:hypothetical protein
VPSAPPLMGGKPKLRADEFFGLTQAEAARRYLKRVGQAVSFDELVHALQEGGCRLTGTNPQKVLYISLIRNTRDFVPPRPGFVGLREFYPARARATGEKVKNGVKTRNRVKSRVPTTSEIKASRRKPGDVAKAIAQVMKDKQPRSPQELAEAVSEKLGRPVQDFAIRGALSGNKEFEQFEGKYRLISLKPNCGAHNVHRLDGGWFHLHLTETTTSTQEPSRRAR